MKRLKSALMSVCMLAALLLAAFMPAGAAMAAADYSFIRVLLSTPHNTNPVTITVNGSYTIKEKPDYTVSSGKYTVKLSGSTVQLEKDGVTTSIGTKCTFVPADYTSTSNTISLKNSKYGTCKYLGDVFFYKNRYRVDKDTVVDKLHVVNRVPMEQYLYGVIGHEMSPSFPKEALKAQAVAARGYAINQLAPGEPNYEVGDTSSDQVYHGYDGNQTVIDAVDVTRGQVVSYNGKVCNTFFSASNGGQTELPGNAFGGGSSKNAEYPYLAQKDDPYDLANGSSREQVFYIPKNIDSVTGDVVVVEEGRTNVRVRSEPDTSDDTNILKKVNGGASFPYVGETGDWYIILYEGENAYISKQFASKRNNGGSGNFPYSYASSQLKALQKAAYNALGSNVSSQNNVQLVSVQSITNGTEQWPGTGSRCYATATAVVNVRYLNNSGNVVTKDGVKCTLTLLDKSEGKYTYSHDFFDKSLRMRNVEEVKSGGQVTGWNLVARRYGHGVGMSQRGAQQRAKDGQSYQEILAFYFDKTQLITVNTGAGAVVDNDPPKASADNLHIEGGDVIYSRKFTARITGVTDEISGVGKVQFAVWCGGAGCGGQDDLKWYDATNEGGGAYSVDVDIANHLNQEGDYYIDVYIYDNAGNLTVVNKVFAMEIDETPPEASAENLKVDGGETINAEEFTIRLTDVTDSGSGMGTVQFAVWCGGAGCGGQDDLRWYDAKDEGNGTYSVEVNMANHKNQKGDYYVHAYLYDKAGNLKKIEKVFQTDFDTAQPVVTEFSASPNPAESKFKITAKVEDDKSGVEKVQFAVWCSTNGQDDLQWYDAKDEGDGTYTYEVNSADHKNQQGWYYIHVYTWDKAGNSGCSLERNAAVEVTGDITPPEASAENLKVDGGETINAEEFTIRLTDVTDSGSGMGTVQFAVWCGGAGCGGQDDLRWYDAKDEGNGTYSVEVNMANHKNQKGDYYVHAYLYDKAGNLKKIEKVFQTDFDTAQPVVTEFSASPNPAESKFKITAKVEDDKSGVEKVQFAVWCSTNGQDDLQWYDAKDEGDGTYTYEVNSADHKNQQGWYYIHVYTWDKAGNSGCSLERNAAVEVTGDITPPTISEMKLVGDSPVNAKSFDVQVTAADSGGIDSVVLRVLNREAGIGEAIEYTAAHKSGDVYQGSIQLLDYLNANGTYEIQAVAEDRAGNKATKTIEVEVAYEYNKKGTISGKNVNVRTQPDVSGDKLGQVNTGDTFTVLDEVETQDKYGKWIAIDYNGRVGYVVATYVTVVDLGGTTPSEPADPPEEEQEWVLIIKTNVNIRSGPSTESQSLGMANKGDKFEYLGEENGWYALTYNGQKAYVRQDMAEIVKE